MKDKPKIVKDYKCSVEILQTKGKDELLSVPKLMPCPIGTSRSDVNFMTVIISKELIEKINARTK